jgi:hypothetical protein
MLSLRPAFLSSASCCLKISGYLVRPFSPPTQKGFLLLDAEVRLQAAPPLREHSDCGGGGELPGQIEERHGAYREANQRHDGAVAYPLIDAQP